MQGTGITFEDVVTAANHIKAQGQNPTIEKIRLYLGSGSNTTINKYLRAWRAQQEIVDEAPPAEWSSDIVKMAAEQAWASIRKEAENKISSAKEEADQAIQQAQVQLLVAIQEKECAQQETTKLSEQLLSLQATHELLSLDFKALQQDYALALERNKGLERTLTANTQQLEQRIKEQSLLHEAECLRSVEQQGVLKDQFEKHLSDIKSQYEAMRHQSMLALDQAREDNKKLDKEAKNLLSTIQEKEQQLIEAKTLIAAHIQQRDDNLTLIATFPVQIERLTKSLIDQDTTHTMTAKDLKEQLTMLSTDMQHTLQTVIQKVDKLKLKKKIVKLKDKVDACT